jgi:hypothetical protein
LVFEKTQPEAKHKANITISIADLKSNKNPKIFDQLTKNHKIRRKICRIIVHEMIKIIGHDEITQVVIDKAIKYACNAAGPLKSICHHLIGDIVHQIIAKIKAKENPMSVCDHL